MVSLYNKIKQYQPTNQQESIDKDMMLKFIQDNEDYLDRKNLLAHFTASIWTVNKERTKTLMVYHNIYDSWSWVGGHADGIEDLSYVALKELREETGVKHAKLVSEDIFSIEVLNVNGHEKKGKYVPCHLHMNVTFLAEADENELLSIKEDENQGVKWCNLDEVCKLSNEKWMIDHVYKKLIEKSR